MNSLNVLCACEFSGTVRDAMTARGHHAVSCDLDEPADTPGIHYQGDVRHILRNPSRWFPGGRIDLMIAHPPCTYLTNAANGSLYKTEPSEHRDTRGTLTGYKFERWKAMIGGACFFRELLTWPTIDHIAVENPEMNPYAVQIVGRNYNQLVQPYDFGDLETKGIGLWLKNLPPLLATEDARAATDAQPYNVRARVHSMAPGPQRSKERSRFFPGVAEAMAVQWADELAS